jgi:EpsI family protein
LHNLRAYVPGAILLVGCALILRARPQEAMPLTRPLSSVLAEVPGYVTTEQKIGKDELQVAGMSSYVARAYVRDSAVAFSTLVSYYDRQTKGRTIHSPRNCLPGAGWEIVDAETRSIAVDGVDHAVNRYTLKNGSLTALAYYWYQGRGRVTASEYAVKWNLLRDAALLGRSDEALVRVVVPVSRGGDTTRFAGNLRSADATAQRLSALLIREVNDVLPRRRPDPSRSVQSSLQRAASRDSLRAE